ncbi:hypothetical protein PSP6_430067 [Paraburkholderia tropica]|uniref:endonuclease domain-containing protein n=1 Tax=Paraburkholderia tropica TaxID=92647 RepID=UPI001CB21596|nr:endonuclease domain-containing protein [Paraburkholderia tropica]CAG9220027.1 hypothetical protein PSP6_430067 [Paraburkholderia tropica]
MTKLKFDFEVSGRPLTDGIGFKHTGMNAAEILVLKEWQWKQQGRRCALCGAKVTSKDAVSDHDHATTVARGVLHRHCNAWLGTMETRGEAAAYEAIKARSERFNASDWLFKARRYLAEWAALVAEVVPVYHAYGALVGKPCQPMPCGFSSKLARARRRARVRRSWEVRTKFCPKTARQLRRPAPVAEWRAAERRLADVSGTLADCIMMAYQIPGFSPVSLLDAK